MTIHPPAAKLVLVVDPDPETARAHARSFLERGYLVTICTSVDETQNLIRARARFDAAVVEVNIDENGDGLLIGRELLSRRLAQQIVFCSATQDLRQAIAAFRMGTLVEKESISVSDALVDAVQSAHSEEP